MLVIERFMCEICQTEYESAEEAEKCEARGIKDMHAGDIPTVGCFVVCGPHYLIHDCHEDWRESYDALSKVVFIVSAITARGHTKIYHLYCPEAPTGGDNLMYTCYGQREMWMAARCREREAWARENFDIWYGKTAKYGSLV